MALALERRKIDTGDAGDPHIIKCQVSHYFDLGGAVVALDSAQVGAVPVERHDEFSAASRVGELDGNMTQRNGLLHGLARLFAQSRFYRMVAFAEKFHQLAHSAPPS